VSDTITTARWFICIYPNYWGRGETPEEAKKAARKAGGRGTEWFIKELPEDAQEPYVDDFGGICWGWPKDWSEDQYAEANRTRSCKLVQASRVTAARMRQLEREDQKSLFCCVNDYVPPDLRKFLIAPGDTVHYADA
jgi:hypothetical protein